MHCRRVRPPDLNPLFAELASLKGVGPRNAKGVAKAIGGSRVVDLLWHFPIGVIDRRFAPKIRDAPDGALVTVTVQVMDHVAPRHRRQPYRVQVSDETGTAALVFFRGNAEYLERQLPVGATRVVSGRTQLYRGGLQITHPDHIGAEEEQAELARVEPTYRLGGGAGQKAVQTAARGAVDRAPDLAEWQDPALVRREGWAGWRESMCAAHSPGTESELAPELPARRRLAYDELLANQLALLLVRRHMRRRPGRGTIGDGRLRDHVLAALPFRPTAAQSLAVGEILGDMAAPSRMLRLLQGDVGSGKTVVALLAMLAAVESGAQAALMAPTEMLARQHHRVLNRLTEGAGVRIGLVTGRDRGKGRESLVRLAASGDAHIVVGTHALFQEQLAFRDLALAVVDEQHRFGVHQRMALADRGGGPPPDVLVMSATPIPRTLTLTVYGDMEVSRIEQKPPGRSPVQTSVVAAERLEEVVSRLVRAVATGARAYWVCPLVSESETVDAAAAEDRYTALAKVLGDRVGLAHGRMKAAARDEVTDRFATGAIQVLVATTVVEVGVDVPEATVMVVEHAERFGLAQLHQLRGRVGRGRGDSSCVLLYAPPLTAAARARLNILRETEDGFRIAEEDLRLRGGGEILGVRQSGLPQFRVADLSAHADLLPVARDDAMAVLERDPDLGTPRGTALRTLLYLFERDTSVRLLRAG